MIEKRAKIDNIDKAKKYLKFWGAEYKGSYNFNDIIYNPEEEKIDLKERYARLRIYKKNNWDTEYKASLVKKEIEIEKGQKKKKTILKKGFKSLKEAYNYIDKNLKYKKLFEYKRKGWEYELGSNKIFLENIEQLGPTVEIESEYEDEIKKLFEVLDVKEEYGDSVPEIMWDKFKSILSCCG
jgi:adenylate cyclase class IV